MSRHSSEPLAVPRLFTNIFVAAALLVTASIVVPHLRDRAEPSHPAHSVHVPMPSAPKM